MVSIALHIVVGAVLVRTLMVPYRLESLFRRDRQVEPERISYVTVPPPAAPASAGRSGGDGRPERPNASRTPTRPLVAPTEVPTGLPPIPSTTPAPAPVADEGGRGPLVGRGGPVKGIEPSFSDPRIWVPAAPVVNAPKSADARMDSVVTTGVRRFADSVAANTYVANKFERGDWTVEKDGKRYGIDQSAIRLGKVSIPLPLLALLPINAQGNPAAAMRAREQAALRADIQFHSQRALNEQEFRKAVKALRERKDRERQQQERDRGRKTIASPDAGRPGQSP